MSEPRTDLNIDQTLAGWMGDVAPDRPPSRMLEETFARTMTAPQARRYPWHKLGIGAETWRGAGSGARIGMRVLALAALVATALAVGLLGGGAKPVPPSPSPSPSASPALAPLPSSIVVTPEAVIEVPRPLGLASSESMIWVLGAGELDRIDPTTSTVTGSVTVGGPADLYNDLKANDDGLWVTDWDTHELVRVDPTTLKVVAHIPAGLAPKGILASAAGVWVADTHDGKVFRIDPATNTIVATIVVGPAGNSGPNWLASGLDSIWVNIPNNSTVVRIDPATDLIQATIPIPTTITPCGGFEFQTTAVWATQCGGKDGVAIIDPATNVVIGTEDHIGRGAIPTLISGGLWISVDSGDAASGMLARIDRATNTFDRVLVTGSAFGGGGALLVDGAAVWVVDSYHQVVLRLPLAAFGS